MIKRLLFVFVVALLLLPLVLPFMRQGFFESDDGHWMIIRLSDFHASLRDGQFPVRWAGRLNFTYGYPVFNFLYPLPFYIGEVFHLIGFGFINSIKLVFVSAVLGSFISSYLWIFYRFGSKAGVIGGLVYVYTPYFLYDIYVRGSLGEIVALAFVPLIFFSIDRFMKHGKLFYLPLLSFGVFGLFTSHNVMAYLFIPFSLFYLVVIRFLEKASVRRLLRALLFFVFGGGMAAFFVIPAILDRAYTIFDSLVISDPFKHLIPLPLLFGEGFIINSKVPYIGSGALIILAFTFAALILNKSPMRKRVAGLFFLVSLMVIFLVSSLSEFLWGSFGFLHIIQFPWRLLSFLPPSLAFLAGYGFLKYTGAVRWIFVTVFGVGFAVSSFFYLSRIIYVSYPDSYYATNDHSTTSSNEYMPRWVSDPPLKRPDQKVEVVSGEATVTDISIKSNMTRFVVNAKSWTLLSVNTVYFPGWNVLREGEPHSFSYKNPKGVIQFYVPEGTHHMTVFLTDTWLWRLSNIISMVSFLIIMSFLVFSFNKTYGVKKLLRFPPSRE